MKRPKREAGHDLDALVAERVMEWVVVPMPDTEGAWSDLWTALDQLEDGRVGVLTPRGLATGTGPADLEDGQMVKWSPSTDMRDAGQVVEKLASNMSLSLCRDREPGRTDSGLAWICEFWDGPASGLGKRDWFARADTAPLAICLAALKTVGHTP